MSSGAALAAAKDLACAYGHENADELSFFERCAVREDGELRILREHFERIFFDSRGLASIDILGQGWFYLLADGTKMPVVTYSSVPDSFSEGLARTVVDGKIAYFDERLEVVLATRYDWGWPFENGVALVCQGCRREPIDEHCGHTAMVGGRWGYIDRQGKEVVSLQETREQARIDLESLRSRDSEGKIEHPDQPRDRPGSRD